VYIKERNDAFGSVEQLTRTYVQEHFNPSTSEPTNIPLFSYSAAVGKGTNDPLNPVFLFQNNLIHEKEGPNDSFVSVESAKWGEHLGTIRLSHLNQINVQVGTKEAKKRYLEFWTGLVQQLKSRGL
jgi:triacylglycerol lipase